MPYLRLSMSVFPVQKRPNVDTNRSCGLSLQDALAVAPVEDVLTDALGFGKASFIFQ